MWATIVKYLGVELIKELTKALISWLSTMNDNRKKKNIQKIKREIDEAIKKRDHRELARKFDKL